MTDLVSILIPAYNSESSLRATVESALNQSWPRKEIIIVDDGSPDSTLEVAKKFESASVKVVTQENSGAPVARNTAFSLAQGDYIQWLDADDLLHPNKISSQLQGADKGGSSLTLRTCAWGKFYFNTEQAEFSRDSLWQDHSPIDWIVTKFADNVWMNPAVWLVSRNLTELAGPWDPRLARSGDDDGEYICRVVANSDRVLFVEEAKCYYRIGTVGSLNWNMESSEESLQSLVLSLQLSVEHLLAMQNSELTRRVSRDYLQEFSQYFYGYDDAYFEQLGSFASSRLLLDLERPSVSWKYRPIQLLTGRSFTRKVITNWRNTKALVRGRLERRALPSGKS